MAQLGIITSVFVVGVLITILFLAGGQSISDVNAATNASIANNLTTSTQYARIQSSTSEIASSINATSEGSGISVGTAIFQGALASIKLFPVAGDIAISILSVIAMTITPLGISTYVPMLFVALFAVIVMSVAAILLNRTGGL